MKIKEGGVMDIQEKKAFEIAFDKKLGARGCQFDLDEDGNYEDRETLCGWHMWLEAKAQAVPEGFVLVKKELPEQIAEKMAIDRIDKPRHENDPVWSEIAEQSYKDQVKSKKWEFWRDYKAMIEAQEPAND